MTNLDTQYYRSLAKPCGQNKNAEIDNPGIPGGDVDSSVLPVITSSRLGSGEKFIFTEPSGFRRGFAKAALRGSLPL